MIEFPHSSQAEAMWAMGDLNFINLPLEFTEYSPWQLTSLDNLVSRTSG